MSKATANGKPRIVATYDYRDEEGGLLYQVVRYEPGFDGEPKTFRQRRPDGKGGWVNGLRDVRRVLYRLPELLAAPRDRLVFVVEGEKDADRLHAEGLLATTNAMGAGKWRPEYAEALHARHVVILPDNDEPGRAHAQAVARSLADAAASLKVVELPGLPPKGDVSDWLGMPGNGKEQLLSCTALRLGCQRSP
jgi:putative DNA primase/helicase